MIIVKKRTKTSVKGDKSRKRLNKTKANLVQHIEQLEKQFPNFSLDSHEHLAYLINRNYGYSNIHKIERAMLTKSLDQLSSSTIFLSHADTTYRSQYYSSPEFLNHMNNISNFKPTKKQEDFDNAVMIYSSFVNIGLNGLKKNLPGEFDKVIDDMITPVQNLLEAIRKFSISYGDKKYQKLNMYDSLGIQSSL